MEASIDAVHAVLTAIPNIGQVHKRRRILRNEQEAKLHLFDTVNQRLNAWMITPAGNNTVIVERNPGHRGIGQAGGGNDFATVQLVLEGYFGIDDAADSETTFRQQMWTVQQTINSYGLLNISGISHQFPADVEFFGYAFVAGWALLHHARVGVSFRERL